MPGRSPSQAEAISIYQAHLDVVSDEILTGKTDVLRNHITLPYLLRTLDNDLIVETEEDLVEGAETFCKAMLALGVNQYIRLVSDAEFLSPYYIQGYHVSHALRNGTPMMPSYSNRMVLQRVRGTWKVAEQVTAFVNGNWPIHMPNIPTYASTTPMFPVDPNDVRRTAAEPLVLYQSFLDKLTAANMADDAAAYAACCSFPYSFHQGDVDTEFATVDDARAFCDDVTAQLEQHGADRFERRADRAEFIGGDRICGYHTSRMYKNGLVVFGPVHSRMILQRKDTQWLLKSVTNTASHTNNTSAAPNQAATLVTVREIQERQRQ